MKTQNKIILFFFGLMLLVSIVLGIIYWSDIKDLFNDGEDDEAADKAVADKAVADKAAADKAAADKAVVPNPDPDTVGNPRGFTEASNYFTVNEKMNDVKLYFDQNVGDSTRVSSLYGTVNLSPLQLTQVGNFITFSYLCTTKTDVLSVTIYNQGNNRSKIVEIPITLKEKPTPTTVVLTDDVIPIHTNFVPEYFTVNKKVNFARLYFDKNIGDSTGISSRNGTVNLSPLNLTQVGNFIEFSYLCTTKTDVLSVWIYNQKNDKHKIVYIPITLRDQTVVNPPTTTVATTLTNLQKTILVQPSIPLYFMFDPATNNTCTSTEKSGCGDPANAVIIGYVLKDDFPNEALKINQKYASSQKDSCFTTSEFVPCHGFNTIYPQPGYILKKAIPGYTHELFRIYSESTTDSCAFTVESLALFNKKCNGSTGSEIKTSLGHIFIIND
jgi:hypothetical protein